MRLLTTHYDFLNPQIDYSVLLSGYSEFALLKCFGKYAQIKNVGLLICRGSLTVAQREWSVVLECIVACSSLKPH